MAPEGRVEIVWNTNAYEDYVIFKDDTTAFDIPYDSVATHDDLVEAVCQMIENRYPDLVGYLEPSDFTITNEEKFWEHKR